MHNSRPEKIASAEPREAGKPRLPDPEVCRARLSGFADRVNCITAGQWCCSFAIPFGLGYLCVHPDRFQIAARTPQNGEGKM
jgi:hypothetical protein